jgi:hypothetical protein
VDLVAAPLGLGDERLSDQLPSPISSISFGNGALWMGHATPTVSVIRIDPRTLHRQLFAKNLS